MNRAAKMLAVLADGKPHTRHDIFNQCGCFFLTNNAASELRTKHGLDVAQWRDGDEIVYRLVSPLDAATAESTPRDVLPSSLPEVVAASSGEHAPGWAGGADPVVDCAAPLVIDGQLAFEVAA